MKTVCFHIYTIQTDKNGPALTYQSIVIDKRCCSMILTLLNVYVNIAM